MLVMADHVDKVIMNSTLLPENTFSVKEEECQEDSIMENKVCIAETAITLGNLELQGLIWHGKIEEYDDASTSLDNIKTELASFEVSEVQNNNIKIFEGISSHDIKTDFHNGQLYCEHCRGYYEGYCNKCGMLVHILNKYVVNNTDSAPQKDIPNGILEIQDCSGHIGIYALRIIPVGVTFGPFTGLSMIECHPWEIKGGKWVVGKNNSKHLNWMQYINPTGNTAEGNLQVFECEDYVYYQSTRQIQAGEELLLYFDEKCGGSSNKIVEVNFVKQYIAMDVFACTFCSFGFSSKSHLVKHKTVCSEGAAEKFSIEELTDCPVCKIHLDPKEFFEHHMVFCYERNARKCILPIPVNGTAKINGSKTSRAQIYKCEQCKYRTKYKTDLRNHTSKKHYKIKTYKSAICNRQHKTQESLQMQVKSRHTYVSKMENEEHSTSDYINAHIKVEQSNSQDQIKQYKCSLCGLQTKYKQHLERHIKSKHLEEFDYECDKCDFRTNNKGDIGRHVKTKHLKEFNYICDKCNFRTNRKSFLKDHVKTKHLKEFNYKCDKCGYKTNRKSSFEDHIRTTHLKELNYKCDICDYRTNRKNVLENHIKSKHLKEFNYKCDKCDLRTNSKGDLRRHIKTKHLKEFNHKCDKCDFETNRKCYLEYHVKTKHLKEFNYKCDKCEFKTNNKYYIETHIKTKHLKELITNVTLEQTGMVI